MAHSRTSSRTPVRSAPASFPAAWTLLLAAAWTGLIAWQTWTRIGWHSSSWSLLDVSRFGALKPSVFFSQLFSVVANWLLLAGFALGAHGWGRLLLEKVFPGGRSRLDAMLYSLGLGLAGWSLLVFVLGIAGLYRPGLFPAIYGLLAASGAWFTWQRRAQLLPRRGWLLGTAPQPCDRALVPLAYGLLALALTATAAPELFFDSLVYHLAVPAQWIMAKGMRLLPFSFYSNLPMNIEALYTGALQLSDERLCRMLHAFLGLLAAVSVFSLGRRWFGRRAGFWAAAVFISVPMTIMNGLESGSDVGAVFFALLGLQALLAWSAAGEGGTRQPWLAGLLMGAGLGAKYNTVFMLGPAALMALLAGLWSGRDWKVLAAGAIRAAGAAFLILLPWLVKSWILTGNPVYPFLYQHFHSPLIHPEKMHIEMEVFKEFGRRTWLQYLRFPWDLTFYMPTNNSFIGPVFLFLAPGILLSAAGWRRASPVLRAFWAAALAAVLIWSVQTQIARYLIPVTPLLAVLGAAALDRWERRRAALGIAVRWATAGFVWFCGLAALAIILPNQDFLGAALGLETRAAYLDRMLMTGYLPIARAAERLPANAKIVFLGETRAYYFPRPATAPSVFDRNLMIELLDRAPDAETVWRTLKGEGYTHLYVHEPEAARTRGFEPYRWTPGALSRLQTLLSRYTRIEVENNGQILYALTDRELAERPVKTGRFLFTYDPETVTKLVAHAQAMSQAVLQNRSQDALAEAQRLAQLAPEWDVPFRQMAPLYLQLNMPEEAFAAYRRADELTRLNAAEYNNLGVGFQEHGQWPEAARCFQAALEQDPALAVARQNLDVVQQHLAGRMQVGKK